MSDIKASTFYKIIYYILCVSMALIAIMTFFDVIDWLQGKPQNIMGIFLAPIFNPVIIFIDLIFGYWTWSKIKLSRKMIRELKWR